MVGGEDGMEITGSDREDGMGVAVSGSEDSSLISHVT